MRWFTTLLLVASTAHADPVFTTGTPSDPATTGGPDDFTIDLGEDDTVPQLMDGTTSLTDMTGSPIGLVNVNKEDDTHYTERWVILEPSQASSLMEAFRLTWSHNATWDEEFAILQTIPGWANRRYIRMDVAYDGPLTSSDVRAADISLQGGTRVTTFELWTSDGTIGGISLRAEPDGWMMRELTVVNGEPQLRDTYLFRGTFESPGAVGEKLEIVADGVGASSQAAFMSSHLGDDIVDQSVVEYTVGRLSDALLE